MIFFVVGGAIRDFAGKTPHDYDLVTNALPNESIKRI
jgi:tRNA nucleotidyltransferase/poly(A) polymerase